MESSPCSICRGRGGSGQAAVFTAECSHQFHSCCVSGSGSVSRGRPVCPLSSARWRELPSLRSTTTSARPPPPSPLPTSQPFFRPMEPRVFSDDDPVDRTPRREPSNGGGAVALTTHCECSALARDASVDDFAVLVHARAPGMSGAGGAAPHAPLDQTTQKPF